MRGRILILQPGDLIERVEPDYGFADSDSAAGTTVSGLVGSAMVAGVAVLICVAGGFFRKKREAH